MISLNQIARLIEARSYSQLIDRILANGRCRSPLVRRMLTGHSASAAAGLGLALQRISEMTYRPEPLADAIANRLLRMQRADGLICAPAHDCHAMAQMNNDESEIASAAGVGATAATAVAARGLLTHQSQRAAAGLATSPAIQLAIDRAMQAIERSHHHASGTDGEATAWAIVLWQLGDVESFRHRVNVDEVLDRLDHTSAELLHDDLCRFAHAMAA